MKILLVCLGNICRSPMAQGIMESELKKLGLNWIIDSAGTNGFHNGDPPDPRAIQLMNQYGINISSQLSRKIQAKDFDFFDQIYCLDNEIFHQCMAMIPSRVDKVKLKNWSDLFPDQLNVEVIDPYYNNCFQEAYDTIFYGIQQILKQNAINISKI